MFFRVFQKRVALSSSLQLVSKMMYRTQGIQAQCCGGAFPRRRMFSKGQQGRRPWRTMGMGDDIAPRERGNWALRELAPRMERMADLVDRFENEFFGGMETFFPSVTREGMRVAIDVREDADKYVITADLPGLTKSDVKIEVSPDRVLTISGERQTEHKEDKESYYRMERRFGKFYRSFTLPKNADESGITAKADEGVLQVMIPKTEKDTTTSRVIDIQ